MDQQGVIEFRSANVLHAIVVRRPAPGTVRFATPCDAPLQVGVLDRPEGHQVAAHVHAAEPLTVVAGSEFLYVESGRIRLELFDEEWNELGVCELSAGDHIVLFRCGHAVTMLEPTRLIEVRQGPLAAAGPQKRFRNDVVSGAQQ